MTAQHSKLWHLEQINLLKNLSLIIFVLPLLIHSCGGDQDDNVIDNVIVEDDFMNYSPADFNNDMMTMVDGSIALVDEVFTSDSSDIVENKENLLFELEIYKGRFESIKFEEGGDAFKGSVEALVDFYIDQFTNKFSDAESILLKGDWTDEEDQVLVEFDNSFADMEGILITTIEREQEAFSNEYSIQLVDREY